MKKIILVTVGVIVISGSAALFIIGKDPEMNSEPAVPVMLEESQSTDSVITETEITPDIIDAAIKDGNFTTLITAIGAVGLTETLKSSGPFTIFAPRDVAFTALPDGTLEGLLQPENATDLAALLTYHIIPSKVLSGSLTDGMVVQTAQGATLTIGVNDSVITVNGATVVSPDMETSNGVIHVIDSVLLPPTE